VAKDHSGNKLRWRDALLGVALLAALLLAADYEASWKADHYNPPNTFKGYDCSQDCSGHRAGYEWAKRKRLSSSAQCTGNSQSFIEGCWAYIEEGRH